MNKVWRFFSDGNHKWRWELRRCDNTVVKASGAGFKEYEACVKNAEENGYRFSPSRSTRAAQSPSHKPRSLHLRFTKAAEKPGKTPT
jgi:hypothetical protein